MVRHRQRAGMGKPRDCRSSDEVPDSVQRVRVLPGGGGTEAEPPVMNNSEPWGGEWKRIPGRGNSICKTSKSWEWLD